MSKDILCLTNRGNCPPDCKARELAEIANKASDFDPLLSNLVVCFGGAVTKDDSKDMTELIFLCKKAVK